MLLRLRTALPDFPKELLPIVADYGIELPYEWSDESSSGEPIAIRGNQLTLNDDRRSAGCWYRILSTGSMVGRPNRWKINAVVGARTGWLAAGITTDAAGIRKTDGNLWTSAASSDDFVVATTGCCSYGANTQVFSIHNFGSGDSVKTNLRSTEYCMSFEADAVEGTLQVSYSDDTADDRNRRFVFDLPESIRSRSNDWRPCVVVSGVVTAAILSWQ
jgi:hypothetical protein